MVYNFFDKSLPTIGKMKYPLVDSTNLVKSSDDVQNDVDELGLDGYEIYDIHAFQALALYLSTAILSTNDILCCRSRFYVSVLAACHLVHPRNFVSILSLYAQYTAFADQAVLQ